MKKISIVLFSFFVFTACQADDSEKPLVLDATRGSVVINDSTFERYQKVLEIAEANDKVSYEDGKVIIKADAPLWVIGLMFFTALMFEVMGGSVLYNVVPRGRELHDKVAFAAFGALIMLLGGGIFAVFIHFMKQRYGDQVLIEIDHNGVFFQGTNLGVKGIHLTWDQIRRISFRIEGWYLNVGFIPFKKELLLEGQSSWVQTLCAIGSFFQGGEPTMFEINSMHLPISVQDFATIIEYFRKKEVNRFNN